MGIFQEYDDLETAGVNCPKCGSFNVTSASFGDDMYLCSDCGYLFGSNIQKEDQEY
ncbi:MAG: hypothetical protein GX756_05890 [Clostridiales bacterium]|nr:hypothetical protein [Clostridiales bacterium]